MWAVIVPKVSYMVKTPTEFKKIDPDYIPEVVGENAAIVSNKWILNYDNKLVEFFDKQETKDTARDLAINGKTIDYYEILAKGNVDIYVQIGVVKALDPNDAIETLNADIIEFTKDDDPVDPLGFLKFKKELLLAWNEGLDGLDNDYINYFTELMLENDWDKITTKEQQEAFDKAGVYIPDRLWLLLPELKNITNITTIKINVSTKENMKVNEDIDIATTLSLKDTAAMEQISKSAINYFPTSAGKMSANTSKQLQKQLLAGMDEGLPHAEIVQNIIKNIPGILDKISKGWLDIAAHTTIHRARERSRLNSYAEAEFEEIVVSAVLDEVTTEQCRWLDGQVISVTAMVNKWNEVEEADIPVDEQFPWLDIRTPRGTDEIQMLRSGIVIASGLRSEGVTGMSWTKGYSTDNRVPAELGLAPYHCKCRTSCIVNIKKI